LCDGDVFLLFMVLSVPSDFTLRQQIRESWGSLASRDRGIRLAFILAQSESKTFKEKIAEESKTHHDIIQKDFIDSYRNLTLKSESILHFAAFYCQNAQFIVKTDSDIFVNVPLLLDILNDFKEGADILGYTKRVRLPFRDKSNKWHIDYSEYPLTFYPDYVDGSCYVIPRTFIKPLFQMSLKTRLLSMEDVYVTGILRSRISLPLRYHNRFSLKPCVFDSC
ncbi:hypothetical protein LOTGIDRAFT_95957, partial [Lottia gigantea]